MNPYASIKNNRNQSNCLASNLTAVLSIKSKIFSLFVHTSFSVCLQMNGNLINTHLVFINIMNDNLHKCLINMISLKCSHNSNLSVLLMFSKDDSKPNYCIWLKYFLIFFPLIFFMTWIYSPLGI